MSRAATRKAAAETASEPVSGPKIEPDATGPGPPDPRQRSNRAVTALIMARRDARSFGLIGWSLLQGPSMYRKGTFARPRDAWAGAC